MNQTNLWKKHAGFCSSYSSTISFAFLYQHWLRKWRCPPLLNWKLQWLSLDVLLVDQNEEGEGADHRIITIHHIITTQPPLRSGRKKKKSFLSLSIAVLSWFSSDFNGFFCFGDEWNCWKSSLFDLFQLCPPVHSVEFTDSFSSNQYQRDLLVFSFTLCSHELSSSMANQQWFLIDN